MIVVLSSFKAKRSSEKEVVVSFVSAVCCLWLFRERLSSLDSGVVTEVIVEKESFLEALLEGTKTGFEDDDEKVNESVELEDKNMHLGIGRQLKCWQFSSVSFVFLKLATVQEPTKIVSCN